MNLIATHAYQVFATAQPVVEAQPLPFPPFVYAIIAAVAFTALALVTWSFRDAANRHSHKTGGSAGHADSHH